MAHQRKEILYFSIINSIIKSFLLQQKRSPEKWKKYTVGSGIEIISEKKAKVKTRLFFSYTLGFY